MDHLEFKEIYWEDAQKAAAGFEMLSMRADALASLYTATCRGNIIEMIFERSFVSPIGMD